MEAQPRIRLPPPSPCSRRRAWSPPSKSDGKRRFTLTESGTEAVASREGPAPWEQVVTDSDPAVFELREVLGGTMAAVKQVFRVGTPTQQAKAVEILTETRRRLYEVLASAED